MMVNSDIVFLRVTAAQATLYLSDHDNKQGRPVMKESQVKLPRGFSFGASAGVVKADGGLRYYAIPGEGPTKFIQFEDVEKNSYAGTNQGGQFYTVVQNDTLSGIAKHFYKNGDKAHYMRIFNANQHLIKDEDHIEAGWELWIPK